MQRGEWVKVTWDCSHWRLLRIDLNQCEGVIEEEGRWPRLTSNGNCPACYDKAHS